MSAACLKRRVATFWLLLLLAFPLTALAWGPGGHRIVATLAEQQIEPQTRAEIRSLLRVAGGRSLADVATWADDVRSDPLQPALSRATARMHFVNFKDSRCHYDAARICANGQCVVAAIGHYAGILGNRRNSDSERVDALRFLVHFVADAHQPLHAGYRPDRGGNNFQVRISGKGSNLHAVWDSQVLANRRLSWEEQARRLASQAVPDDARDPADWVEQACRITRDAGIYPPSRSIDRVYLERMRPVAERQIRLAASHLASLLDRTLD